MSLDFPFSALSALEDVVSILHNINVSILYIQDTAILELSAISDEIPEEVEIFQVILGTPGGGARLGVYREKTVMIDRNDAPYGKLTVHRTDARCNIYVFIYSQTL